jgi:hypothetical protein
VLEEREGGGIVERVCHTTDARLIPKVSPLHVAFVEEYDRRIKYRGKDRRVCGQAL